MENPKRTHYIFVDFENTQVMDVRLLSGKPVILLVVTGDKQKQLPIPLIKQLLANADQVGLIEANCSGKNALDLVLAYHMGQWAKQDPTGYFHIVSKDKGFDPLITHLKQLKVSAARHDEFTQIPLFVDQVARQTPSFRSGRIARVAKPPYVR
ncbi:NYN domain-containing protein [Thiothrix litoralis]|uniref:NYN domain-containing protein n=1 Tax=Thiothrix litoralis TaxID=2891210 RepID=A0ABX7WUC4_9GAMM|nr:PIN domain-containing protein [Thiothrix litoralis]QTR44520.1 NYN domain-containing protein [Thiothrix litoralis]